MHTAVRTLVLLIFVLSASVLLGQVATGTYTYGSFDSYGFDTVNVANLNVHASIPVLNKAGRAGLNFRYNLTYDNSLWTPTTVSGSLIWQPSADFGWNIDTNNMTGYARYKVTTITGCANPDGTNKPVRGSSLSNFVYTDMFGVAHSFDLSLGGCPDALISSDTAVAKDGSGYTMIGDMNATNMITIVDSVGHTFTPPKSSSKSGAGGSLDSNGNYISVDASGNYTDTTGNIVLSVTSPASTTRTFAYKDASGASQAVTLTYRAYTVQTNFGCSGISEYGPTSALLVDSMSYPDGSTYHFSYEATPGASGNVTGRLAGVGLPQGGSITYAYAGGSNGIVCSDGSAAGLTRTLASNSGSAASIISYARTPGTSTSHTDVVDGQSNHLSYDFVKPTNQPSTISALYYETNRQVYQGAASGTPVVARATCYNGASSPCSTTTFALPITQIATYETLDGTETHGTTVQYSAYGVATETDIYDFAASTTSRGPLLSRETFSYATSRPGILTKDQIYDRTTTNLAGETDNYYDTATLTASSGVPQHQVATDTRGNLTGVMRYSGPESFIYSNATYADTGSLLTSQSINGGPITTVSYDSTFTFPTGTTLPTPSSGVSLSTSASYDVGNSGLLLSSIDANQQSSTTSYDSMLRVKEIDSPDGGITTYSYTPNQTSTHTYQSSSVYSDTEVGYDGYGRTSRIAVANGQSGNGWYQKDLCYDANGHVLFTSYPYQGTGLGSSKVCSGAGDTYTYDVLGRVTAIARGNGESVSYSYSGRATKSIDENGVARITQVDGLGRTTIVCEISSNSSLPNSGSPTGCGTDIAGSGFVTSYAYDLSTHTTTVTQGAQTRIFRTDWLGRPTWIQEPESGTTTYSYAHNSTGLAVTRKRPRANQTNASILTTTTTQYDVLDRVVSITYDDGTPTKTFAYDASAGWADLAQSNLKGRLSIASVPTAKTVISYDATGRTSYLDTCLPSGCGNANYNRQLHYTYDLAGNLVSSTDGAGTTTSYTLSPANEILSLRSSLNDPTNPANIVSNALYGPSGPVSYSLGNGLTGTYSYDTQGRTQSGTISNSGSQVYGFSSGWRGTRLTGSADSVLGQGATYGYDEFNRLTSRTVNSGTPQNFNWVYDRYGNRIQQNVTAGSGPQPQFSINSSNNQIVGYTYDAAGNLLNDGQHSYTYDAEGNLTAVDGGATASYIYDALNHRVQTVVGGTVTEFLFNASGQRASVWNGTTHAVLRGQYYWGSKSVAYYANSSIHFQHQDWLGTERKHTAYNGIDEETLTSLPFGDLQTASGSDNDYAMLSYDSETGTDHAQFRQYSGTQGRWMSPDPYSGSYDFNNPQSFNRYAYVLNNPLSFLDVSGLSCVSGGYVDGNGVFYAQLADDGDGLGCAAAGVAPSSSGDPTGTQDGTIGAIVYDWIFQIGQSSYSGTSQIGDRVTANNGNNTSVLDPKPTTKQKILNFVCKNSPKNRILASMEFGAVKGIIQGGVVGATGGAFFEGVGAIPGAFIGGFVGGVAGAGGGVLSGGAMAGACSLGGTY